MRIARLATRIRRGLRRRAGRALERVGLRSAPEHRAPAPQPSQAPAAEASPTPAPAAPVEPPAPAGPTRETVQALLDDLVRPALQADGGDITLVKVERGDIHVRLTGACHGCPSSEMTLRMGIERLLEEELPGFERLIQVDAGVAA